MDNVPSIGHSLVVRLAVILHSLFHSIVDHLLHVILENVDGDGDTDQAQEDQSHHGGVGVDHAVVFGASATAAEETDEKHDSSDDDQDDGGVEVGVSQEVQVLLHLELDVGADGDESHRAEEDHEVEEEDDVFQHVVATTHLGRVL